MAIRNFGKGWRPSPAHRLGLGPLQNLELAAGPLPDKAHVALPDALTQLFQDCVANSTAVAVCHAIAVQQGTPEGPWPELPSRGFIYALARLLSGQELTDDDGTYIHAAFEGMAGYGFLQESQWAYGPDHLTQAPDWGALRSAADQKLIRGARRIVSIGQRLILDVATAIAGGLAVPWGTDLDQAFELLNPGEVWPGVRGRVLGGHAMLLHAYRRTPDGRFQFASRSSWGRDFADNGSGWVDEDAIASNHSDDFWVVEAAPNYSKEIA